MLEGLVFLWFFGFFVTAAWYSETNRKDNYVFVVSLLWPVSIPYLTFGVLRDHLWKNTD